ncbi:MAG: hypothetical protein EA425_14430 [Puniceicoccaceae bacterium]|nr:MAG: hypothetical protein EA425_14430 [Puniceicoccaceae bacterium]
MKKVAIGCLVVALLAMLGVAAGGFYLYQKFGEGFAELASFSNEYHQIQETAPRQPGWSPPPDRRPTEAQIEALVAVEAGLLETIESTINELDQRIEELRDRFEAARGLGDIRELVEHGRGVTDLALAYKCRQVAELHEAGLSIEEYNWLREISLRALFVYQGSGGAEEPEPRLLEAWRVDPATVARVAPHVEILGRTLPLALIDAMMPGGGMEWPEGDED